MADKYKFKAGDKVITSLGKKGIITGICKCAKCRERGFYEPAVKAEAEDDYIIITNTDYKNGFKDFYKIGDYVFGNVDWDALIEQNERLCKGLCSLVEHIKTLRNAEKGMKECN